MTATSSPVPNAEVGSASSSLPSVRLPGADRTIDATACELGNLLGARETHFRRGGQVVRVEHCEGQPQFRPVTADALRSDFEQIASLYKLKLAEPAPIAVPTRCSKTDAQGILAAQAFREALPPIKSIHGCPLLIEDGSKLRVITSYHRTSGVYASGTPCPEVDLQAAVDLLLELLGDFNFASPADKSRAIAALLTPALVAGGLLNGRPPLDVIEADASQTGKGYFLKLRTAIFNARAAVVTQRRGGTGSLENSFDAALIRGAAFVQIDNVRGKIDSQALECFLTEPLYTARGAYTPETEIDTRRHIISLSSNSAEMTPDLGNRSNVIRLHKQAPGYSFKSYPEGDALDHVIANQPLFLGAVFRVVQEWHKRGKPKTRESRHEFRPWAQTMDWIVQNVFGAAPLMDGHQDVKRQLTNPNLGWLRQVAIAVRSANKLGQSLQPHELLDVLLNDADVEIPGLNPGHNIDEERTQAAVLQAIGRKMSRCFGADDRLELQGIVVTREHWRDAQSRERKAYRFDQDVSAIADASIDWEPTRLALLSGPQATNSPNDAAVSVPTIGPTDGPLIGPTNESRVSTIPTDDWAYFSAKQETIPVMESLVGIVGPGEQDVASFVVPQGAGQGQVPADADSGSSLGSDSSQGGHPQCPRCRGREFKGHRVRDGQAVRRDCVVCGWTLDFPVWQGDGLTADVGGLVGRGAATPR